MVSELSNEKLGAASVPSNNLRDVFDIVLVPPDIVTPADGYAYGIEFFGQKMAGKLSGWLAYTFSVSRKRMNSIFDVAEKEYYTNWDRTHAFSALGNYQFNKKWELNWRWTLQSGQAYTPILGYYVQKFPESPEEILVKDKVIAFALIGWFLTILIIFFRLLRVSGRFLC